MKTHADKTQENKSHSLANSVTQKKNAEESTFQFVDNRPEAVTQRKLQEVANNCVQAKQSAQQQSIQKKEKKTGIENVSGYSMDDVKGFPYEAWHVVQQKQGRVKPIMQMNTKDNNSQLIADSDSPTNDIIQRNVVVEAALDPLNDSLFQNVTVAGRPPTLLGAAQGNHTTPFAVFVSGIRNHIRGRNYQQAFNNILSIARVDREELPGMSKAPENARAIAAYQNFTAYAAGIDPAARSERHWIEDIQQLTARYLTFRNLVPISTEAGDPHGGDGEGDITRELELIDSRLKSEQDFRPPKNPIKQLFNSLFDDNNTLGPDAVEQHKISLVNAYPTAYEYANT